MASMQIYDLIPDMNTFASIFSMNFSDKIVTGTIYIC